MLYHLTYIWILSVDTEFVLPAVEANLLQIGGEELAVDVVAEGITPLLQQISIDVEAGTVAAFGINGGAPLPYEEWVQAMVEAGAYILPIAGDDPVVNEAVFDLLVRSKSTVYVFAH